MALQTTINNLNIYRYKEKRLPYIAKMKIPDKEDRQTYRLHYKSVPAENVLCRGQMRMKIEIEN